MNIQYRVDKCFITCGELVSVCAFTSLKVEGAINKVIELENKPPEIPYDYDYFYEIQVIYD